MATPSNEFSEQEKALAAERAMLQGARDFLYSPLAQAMVMNQKNIDAIVEQMRIHGLQLNEGGFRSGYLLAREGGLLEMKPVPVDSAALAAAEAEKKRIQELEEKVKAAEEVRQKEIQAAQKRVEWAARDQADGRHDVNRHEENQALANARIYREGLERANAEIEEQRKKLNQKSANDPNDFSSLPSISEIVAEGGEHMSVEQFKTLSLAQGKEYRKRWQAAQQKMQVEKNNERGRK